jgi:hypothetical protein
MEFLYVDRSTCIGVVKIITNLQITFLNLVFSLIVEIRQVRRRF